MNKRVAYLLVNLKKAYDSINKDTLIKIMWKRCTSNEEKVIVSLIANLTTNNTIKYKNQEFEAHKGVVYISILSPFLFNVYLEEALKSEEILEKDIKYGNFIAFSDDILIKVKNAKEMEQFIEALEKLQTTFGLKLNKEKTVFLSDAK